MPLLISQLMFITSTLQTEDGDMFSSLSSSAAAAKGGTQRENPSLEEKLIQAACARSQLDSMLALGLP